MTNKKSIFYNKTKNSIVWGIVALVCLILFIASKMLGYVLNENISLIFGAIFLFSFIFAVENLAFYVDDKSIKVLFTTIYWKDITKIEMEKPFSAVSNFGITIYHSGKRTKIGYIKFILLESICVLVFMLFYKYNVIYNKIFTLIVLLAMLQITIYITRLTSLWSSTEFIPIRLNSIMRAIESCSKVYSFNVQREGNIYFEDKIVLTNPNADNKK